MNTLFENSNKGTSRISCIKYKHLNNLSHYHNDYELIYINKGRAKISIDEHVFWLEENDSILVYSNEIHYIISDETTLITVLKADKDYFDPLLAHKMLVSPLIHTDAEVKTFLETIHVEFKMGDEYSHTVVNCMTNLFFISLFRRYPTTERRNAPPGIMNSHELYSELCKKIAREYNTITFKEAAQFMNYSEKHFSKMFRILFGMTFTEYLNIIKISEAIQKLKQGHMSISTIADSCGFNTIRNFNRVFKQFTGYSPTSIPSDYVYLYNLQAGYGLNPTLSCTVVLNE